MEKNQIVDVLKKVREAKPKKFKQSVDFIVNLRDLDLKKPEHQVDIFVALPFSSGRKEKIAALVDSDMMDDAREVCDTVIVADEFPKYAKDKKLTKKLAVSHNFFIAQSNVMAKVASSFGRVLGPKGKMPNPKAGCVVPPKAALKPLYDRLQRTIRVNAKLQPLVQVRVGTEEMNDDDIAANVVSVYEQLIHALPNGELNVRSAYVKLTMGSAVKLK